MVWMWGFWATWFMACVEVRSKPFGVSPSTTTAERLKRFLNWSLSHSTCSRISYKVDEARHKYSPDSFSLSSLTVAYFCDRNSGFYQRQRQPSLLPVLVSGREMARPGQQALGEETHHSGGERTSLTTTAYRQRVGEPVADFQFWQPKSSFFCTKAVRVCEK